MFQNILPINLMSTNGNTHCSRLAESSIVKTCPLYDDRL